MRRRRPFVPKIQHVTYPDPVAAGTPERFASTADRSTGRYSYVAQLPGDGGVDWGYTNDPHSANDPAIRLSVYWQRRFRADRMHCNQPCQFHEVV